jgi:hypothetical protein
MKQFSRYHTKLSLDTGYSIIHIEHLVLHLTWVAVCTDAVKWSYRRCLMAISVSGEDGTCRCGGGIPTINTWLQMICTFIGMLCKYTICIMRSSWCSWSAVDCDGRATCSWNRLTALLLERLLGVLLFTFGWFPLKSSPTCSYRWLNCDLQNVPHEYAKCTAGTVRVNWSEASSWLNCVVSFNCLEADPSENTARNNTCCDCWLPWKSCLSECCLDTNLLKRYLVTDSYHVGGFHARLPHRNRQIFIYLLHFTVYSRYLKRVISKRDGCEYLKQVPSIDGSLELI